MRMDECLHPGCDRSESIINPKSIKFNDIVRDVWIQSMIADRMRH